jgi:hypothetical protein
VGPRIASFQLAGLGVGFHEPPPGRNYWRELFDKHGETLYRLNWGTHDHAESVSYLEGKGGKLTLGDPASSPYVNVSLWPKYGFAVEINTDQPTPEQASHPVVLKPAPVRQKPPEPPAFGSNPITSVGFVVPNLDQAVKEYADLFKLPSSAVTPVSRPNGFPAKTAALHFSNGTVVELNEPRAGQSIFRTRLRKDGTSMFCLNFHVKSVQEQVEYLKSKGGTLVSGGGDAPYAYVDMRPRLGAMFEVHE